MTEINSSTPDRKSRREALGLLLGTALIGSAACSQPDKPPSPTDAKPRPVVIILEDKGDFDPIFDKQHLNKPRSDILVVVNIATEDVTFQVNNSPFDESCVVIKPSKHKKLKITGGPGQYRFNTFEGDKCSASSTEQARAAGDIIIDP